MNVLTYPFTGHTIHFLTSGSVQLQVRFANIQETHLVQFLRSPLTNRRGSRERFYVPRSGHLPMRRGTIAGLSYSRYFKYTGPCIDCVVVKNWFKTSNGRLETTFYHYRLDYPFENNASRTQNTEDLLLEQYLFSFSSDLCCDTLA
jgi:hypothetical protein